MTLRIIQKMQEENYQIIHRPGETHCNADGFSRKSNEIREWKEGEEEELRCPIPEFQTMEKALRGAEEDINSRNFLKKRDADVMVHARMLIPHHPRGVVNMQLENSLNRLVPWFFAYQATCEIYCCQ